MEIFAKDVRRQIDLMPHAGDESFSITYRKADGSWGEKKQCRNRSGQPVSSSPSLSNVKTENRRAGKLRLEYRTDDGRWQKFEVWLCLLITFNGHLVDHRF
ncbi:MAG: hypothetical protein U0X91_20685 [Spirosomataceae bacterium]